VVKKTKNAQLIMSLTQNPKPKIFFFTADSEDLPSLSRLWTAL